MAGLVSCSSAGVTVGKSAGVTAAGVSIVKAGSCGMFPLFGFGDDLQLDSNVGELHRGDVVSYRVTPAGLEPQEMIHRIVGLPGERLEPGPDGGVLINGAPLVEDYLPPDMTTYLRKAVDVPADHFFLMGDNRGRSSDSRVAGSIPRADILSRFVKAVPAETDEDDACELVPSEPPGPPLTIKDSDPPAVQLVLLRVIVLQAASQDVTAANLDAVRVEVRTDTDRLEALLRQVGSAAQETDRVFADEVLPALRAMLAAPSVEEWTARREGLTAAVNRSMRAARADVRRQQP